MPPKYTTTTNNNNNIEKKNVTNLKKLPDAIAMSIYIEVHHNIRTILLLLFTLQFMTLKIYFILCYTMVCVNTLLWLAGSCATKLFNTQVGRHKFNVLVTHKLQLVSLHSLRGKKKELANKVYTNWVINRWVTPAFAFKKVGNWVYVCLFPSTALLHCPSELTDTSQSSQSCSLFNPRLLMETIACHFLPEHFYWFGDNNMTG